MSANNLLIESTRKLITLTNIQGWTNELMDKAPPVLWFGNSKSEKPKIITFGANPSRWEFLDQTASKNCQMIKSVYENLYLKQSNRRFNQLEQNSCYSDILSNQRLQDDIIKSYDNYFKTGNSYRWFGKEKNDSYNAEGVLRGLCASYFENDTKYRACHIDLFPFATISNFNKIQSTTVKDVLAQNWAKDIVDELLCLLNPTVLLMFGRNNFDYFCRYFNVSKGNPIKWISTSNKGKCDYYITKYKTHLIIGLSVNLGNPKGFDAPGLTELGQKLCFELKQHKVFEEPITVDTTENLFDRNEYWFKITFEKNYFESFHKWHIRKYLSIAVINPEGSVSLASGGNETGNIVLKQVMLTGSDVEDMVKLINNILSDPLKAQTELEKSSIVAHIAHVNPINIKIERFENVELANGITVLSWEGNAMFIEDGLLKQIETLMKIGNVKT